MDPVRAAAARKQSRYICRALSSFPTISPTSLLRSAWSERATSPSNFLPLVLPPYPDSMYPDTGLCLDQFLNPSASLFVGREVIRCVLSFSDPPVNATSSSRRVVVVV